MNIVLGITEDKAVGRNYTCKILHSHRRETVEPFSSLGLNSPEPRRPTIADSITSTAK